jgi:hypothetical protein
MKRVIILLSILFLAQCGKDSVSPEPKIVRRQVIFFASDRNGGNMNIWRMEMDGSNPKQITFYTRGDFYPLEISPDGKRLLYLRLDRYTLVTALYEMHLLSEPPDIDDFFVPGLVGRGSYTADGKSVVYSWYVWINDSLAHEMLFRYHLDTGEYISLTPPGQTAWNPTVSRRNNNIAYNIFDNDTIYFRRSQIILADENGNFLRQLSHLSPSDAYYATDPRFSLDGSKLFFRSDMVGPFYKPCYVDMSDYSIHQVPYVPIDKFKNVWEPCPDTAGTRVFFRSMVDNIPKPDSTAEIIAINIDGSGTKRLTNNNFRDYRPVVGVAEFWE